MTDQELCKLIAERVMGWTIKKQTDGPSVWINERGNWEAYAYSWNPLNDGGQALEIVEKLKMTISWNRYTNRWIAANNGWTDRSSDDDLKRAIVLCAARCVGVEG